jgi:hypothetical protein
MGPEAAAIDSPVSEFLEVVVPNADGRFYELLADGQDAGILAYGEAGGRYVFTHTFIAAGSRGRGLSRVLLPGRGAECAGGHQSAAPHRDELRPGP